MPHIVQDRILESTTTTGTGDIALTAAITGFRRFNAVCAVGDTVPYFIEAIDATGLPTGEYEYGTGTYTAANTLARTQVQGSSNAGALVVFSTGSKNVGIAALASSLVPTGSKHEFPCTTAPLGFLVAQGQLLSRIAYPALWQFAQGSGNILATDAAWVAGGLSTCGQFSPGDGTTNFRLPDWRGMHFRSADGGRGIDAGRAVGSYEADGIKDHTHSTGQTGTGLNGSVATDGSTVGVIGTGVLSTGSATGGIAENRVKTIAMLACIKT